MLRCCSLSSTGAAFSRREKAAIVALLRQGWLAPKSNDDIFELLILVRSIAAISSALKAGPGAIELTPMSIAKGAIAAVRGQRAEARIFFDKAPHVALSDFSESEYFQSQFLQWYTGVDVGARRPDLLVELSVPGREIIRFLIEAKNTELGSKYARDSIYKVLGYIADFDRVWRSSERCPKAVLVFRDGAVCVSPEKARREKVVITTLEKFSDEISTIVSLFLTT